MLQQESMADSIFLQNFKFLAKEICLSLFNKNTQPTSPSHIGSQTFGACFGLAVAYLIYSPCERQDFLHLLKTLRHTLLNPQPVTLPFYLQLMGVVETVMYIQYPQLQNAVNAHSQTIEQNIELASNIIADESYVEEKIIVRANNLPRLLHYIKHIISTEPYASLGIVIGANHHAVAIEFQAHSFQLFDEYLPDFVRTYHNYHTLFNTIKSALKLEDDSLAVLFFTHPKLTQKSNTKIENIQGFVESLIEKKYGQRYERAIDFYLGNFICQFCQKDLSSSYNLLRHYNSAHYERLTVPCQDVTCKIRFTSQETAKKHFQQSHKDSLPAFNRSAPASNSAAATAPASNSAAAAGDNDLYTASTPLDLREVVLDSSIFSGQGVNNISGADDLDLSDRNLFSGTTANATTSTFRYNTPTSASSLPSSAPSFSGFRSPLTTATTSNTARLKYNSSRDLSTFLSSSSTAPPVTTTASSSLSHSSSSLSFAPPVPATTSTLFSAPVSANSLPPSSSSSSTIPAIPSAHSLPSSDTNSYTSVYFNSLSQAEQRALTNEYLNALAIVESLTEQIPSSVRETVGHSLPFLQGQNQCEFCGRGFMKQTSLMWHKNRCPNAPK